MDSHQVKDKRVAHIGTATYSNLSPFAHEIRSVEASKGGKFEGDSCMDISFLQQPSHMRPTCHGYSLASVSCPPTILVRLLAWPQVQVLVLVLGIVVAVGCVVVDTDKGAVVDARNMRFELKLLLKH